MAEPFVGEIRAFPYPFTPRGWASCNGRMVPITQNSVLAGVIGTMYGGDGRQTFGLPNLGGRSPCHAGASAGPGLTRFHPGSFGGAATIILQPSNLPSHNHTGYSELDTSEKNSPTGNMPGVLQYEGDEGSYAYIKATPETQAGRSFMSDAGAGKGHPNQQPFLVIPFFIALEGIYPPRS